MIRWALDLLGGLKTWAAAAGIVALLLVGSNGFTFWKTDRTAYARGVRDQKIVSIGATEVLNAKIEAAEDEAREAAREAATARRQLFNLQMENARDRARDPLAAGSGLPLSELRRVFRVH